MARPTGLHVPGLPFRCATDIAEEFLNQFAFNIITTVCDFNNIKNLKVRIKNVSVM